MFGARRRIRLVSAVATALSLTVGGVAHAESNDVSPEALETLRSMTHYIGGLDSFTVTTENTLDEVLDSGEKVPHHFTARLSIRRPDALRAERTGDGLDQVIVYDGKTIAIEDRSAGYFARVPAPADLDAALHFARDDLDIVPPSGDIVYTDAYALLTAGLESARVVGKAKLDGVLCNRVVFRNELVEFEFWIADGDRPLPRRYVLTTRDDPAAPRFIVRMSDWEVDPELDDARFVLSQAAGSKEIDFVRIDQGFEYGSQTNP